MCHTLYPHVPTRALTPRNLLQLQCFPLPFHTIPRCGSLRGACSLRGTVWPCEVTPTYLLNCAVLQEVAGAAAAAFLYSRDLCVSLLAISTHRQQPTGTQDHRIAGNTLTALPGTKNTLAATKNTPLAATENTCGHRKHHSGKGKHHGNKTHQNGNKKHYTPSPLQRLTAEASSTKPENCTRT